MPRRDLRTIGALAIARGRRGDSVPGCRAGAEGGREAVDDAAHAGRQAGPAGQLEQRHADAARAAGEPGRRSSPRNRPTPSRIARSWCASSATRRAIRTGRRRRSGGEDRPLPPGEPTFIEQISAAAGGKVGGYNNFWLDPGERVMRVDGLPRSSIVVDPPDGRVPALTRRSAAAGRRAARAPPGNSASSIIPSCAAWPSAA